MKVSNIEDVLVNFINSNSMKSLLIDGKWGCGKSHQINEYLKKTNRKEVLYLSLFGLESIDEINNTLCNLTSNKLVHWFTNSLGVVMNKTIKTFLPYIKDFNLDFQLNINNRNVNKKIKKGKTIIFDDLERLSTQISYEDLYGYINSLFIYGTKVVFICSDEHIDSERKREFSKFKEKVIDKIVLINESPNEVINKILDDDELKIDDSFYDFFESNIRKVKRIKQNYDLIINIFNDKFKSSNNLLYPRNVLFRAVSYADSLIFNYFEPSENVKYERNILEKYGKNIAIGVNKLTENLMILDDFKRYRFKELVFGIIDYILYNDNEGIDKLIRCSNTSNISSILDQEYYFLSDVQKQEYINKIKEEILIDNKFWIKYKEKFSSLLYTVYIEFSQKEIKKLSKQLYGNGYSFKDNVTEIFPFMNSELRTKYALFFENISTELKSIQINDSLNDLVKFYNEKDYENLVFVIDNLIRDGLINSNDINDFIQKNNYLLPDLSSNINYVIWDFCNTICKYAIIANKNNFLDYLKKLYDISTSESEKSRIIDMIQNNYKKDFSFLNYLGL